MTCIILNKQNKKVYPYHKYLWGTCGWGRSGIIWIEQHGLGRILSKGHCCCPPLRRGMALGQTEPVGGNNKLSNVTNCDRFVTKIVKNGDQIVANCDQKWQLWPRFQTWERLSMAGPAWRGSKQRVTASRAPDPSAAETRISEACRESYDFYSNSLLIVTKYTKLVWFDLWHCLLL